MVSKDFREAAEDGSLWEDAYTERFLTRQGNGSAPHSAGLMSQADRKKSPQRRGGKSSRNGVKRRYLKRIMDPQVSYRVFSRSMNNATAMTHGKNIAPRKYLTDRYRIHAALTKSNRYSTATGELSMPPSLGGWGVIGFSRTGW